MLTMKLTSGPYAGRVRDITGTDPEGLFHSLIHQGWAWEINWSNATPWEKFMWGRYETAARAMRALMQGRPVKFMGATYVADTPEDFEKAAQEVQDAVAKSGRMVSAGLDNEQGFVIEAHEMLQ